MNTMAWLEDWATAREDAGYGCDTDLPIFDFADETMAQMALEKLWSDAQARGLSPEEAVAIAEDRNEFAVKYYDPYVEEFKAKLRRSGRL